MPITAPHTPVLPSDKYKGKTTIGAYGNFVVMIDDMVQQIVETLKKNNQLDNTIIIFTSDNGCAPYIGVTEMEKQGHFPSYIYRGYKTDIYEGGHRIPLIVSWKGKFSNKISNSLVSLTDFYATFAQMVNHKLKTEEAVDSYSIWPILSKEGTSTRKDLVYESGKGYLSLRTPRLKLVLMEVQADGDTPINLQIWPNYPQCNYLILKKTHQKKKILSTTNAMNRK